MVIDEEMEREYRNFFTEYSDVVTIAEMSRMLKVCETTSRDLIRNGKVLGVKVGQAYRIPKREIFKLMCIPEKEAEGNGNSNNPAKV